MRAADARHCYRQPVTDRTGLGPIDLAVLQAIDTYTADHPRRYVACSQVLPVIEERIGLGPRYAYDALVDLARYWVIPVPVITARGNIGDRYSPASEPQHVECRPSRAGQVVLDAEAGRLARVPVGLINGTAYRGGTQPPLQPARVIAALRHLLDHPGTADSELLSLAGPPYSVTGCTITGDLDALAAGQCIMLRQTGRIIRTGTPVPDRRPPLPPEIAARADQPGVHHGWVSTGPDHLSRAHLVIESLPPGVSPAQVCCDLASHRRPGPHHVTRSGRRYDITLPISDIADLSRDGVPVHIAITLRPGTDPEAARDQLAAFDGITTQAPAAHPISLVSLLRTWARQHRREDVAASLTGLHDAIRHDQQRAPRG